MSDITHSEMVAVLVKPGADIASGMTAGEADLWHAATGVAGESIEILDAVMVSYYGDVLDHANMVEELGDMEFYFEQLRQNLGVPRNEASGVFIGPLLDSAVHLSIACGNILDQAKKVAIYKKAVDLEAMTGYMDMAETFMESIRKSIGVSYEETLTGNIAKLSVRYNGLKYSDTAAQTRADKA